jgi:hypothetical protein
LRRLVDIEIRLETGIQLSIRSDFGFLGQKEALEESVRFRHIVSMRPGQLTTRMSTNLGIDRCRLVMAIPGSIV